MPTRPTNTTAPTATDPVAQAKSRVGNAVQTDGPNAARTLDARRDLAAELIKKRAREIVARSPRRLTDAQVEEVVRILRRSASTIASADLDTAGS